MPNKYYLQAGSFDYNDVCIYACTHNERDGAQLQDDFESTLNAVKTADPDTWNLNDVFEAMENLHGWKIEPIETVDVYY